MTLRDFTALSYDQQLVRVLSQGTYLATRWANLVVNLYRLPSGLFVEVYYNAPARHITQVRAFMGISGLAAYAEYFQQPKGIG